MSLEAKSGVCVIVAAYNASATIQRAVRSALDQPEATEIIVVDDASTDDTAALAQALDDGSGRLKVIRLDMNAGPAAARNRALIASKAAFVTPLDADDYMLAGRLGKLLGHMGAADFIADDLFRQFEGEEEVSPINLLNGDADTSQDLTLTLTHFVSRNISRMGHSRRELGFLKPLIRRSFLDSNQLRYEESMRLGEDYALYTLALAKGARFVLAPGFGYVAVHRNTSLSSRHSKEDLCRMYEFDRRLMATCNLTPEERRAVNQHARSIRLKVDHREILDVKGDHRYLRILWRLLRRPRTAIYVLVQTGVDKLGFRSES